ncbi:MAG: S41 family peptidase [Opitutus sp.]
MDTPRRNFLLPFASLLLAFLAGCATAPRARVDLSDIPVRQVARAERNLSVFNEVWDLVNRKHYDSRYHGVDWEEAAAVHGPAAAAAADPDALYKAINDMLEPLGDSHTHALTPDRAEERRTRLRARIGFSMLRMDGQWVVSEVLPGSPAQEAGVKPGWIVISRNGVELGERVEIQAREGEEARWEFVDERDQRVILSPLARRLPTAPRQIVTELDGGFVHLRFDGFSAATRRWLRRQLNIHRDAPGVVVDLRNNSGGDTFSLGSAVGEFFPRAVNCGTFVTRGGSRRIKSSWQLGSARYPGPVVILIDSMSASAAEIFTAVLQDHGRATVVGRRTAGAVLASRFYRLPDDGELQLSRYDYATPKGRRIEGAGVEPDIPVSRTLGDIRAGRDPDLDMALRVLRGE